MLEDSKNKMMQAAPAKKGWHFPSDGLHFAEFIEAETIEEATTLYHKAKRLFPTSAAGEAVVAQQSTPTLAPTDPQEQVE